jgi:hypothetical protein
MISAISGGIRAFHGHQHGSGIAKNPGIFGQRQRVRGDVPLEIPKTRQPQPVTFDFPDHARARQQGGAAAGDRVHAADKAADAAGPRHADRSVRNHFAFEQCRLGSIAEFPVPRLFG